MAVHEMHCITIYTYICISYMYCISYCISISTFGVHGSHACLGLQLRCRSASPATVSSAGHADP